MRAYAFFEDGGPWPGPGPRGCSTELGCLEFQAKGGRPRLADMQTCCCRVRRVAWNLQGDFPVPEYPEKKKPP